MRKYVMLVVVLAVIIGVAGFVYGKELKGKVVSIQDGDTITILKDREQIRIRLFGIDCPEKKQAYGDIAKRFTSSLVFGKTVFVKYTGKDRYGRVLGTVFTKSGTNLNKELLKAGLAWHYKKYDDNPELARLENQARKARAGLWADPYPVPPWSYRHKKK
jgi:micrococcal nuclease